MKSQYQRNKKGVSEIISYSILIIIALGAGTLVYAFFVLSAPKNQPTCNEDLSVAISDVKCDYTSYLNISLVNKGNFNITAAYIRVGFAGNKTRYWLNQNDAGNVSLYMTPDIAPGEERTISFNKLQMGDPNKILNYAGNYILEIEPAMQDSNVNRLAACSGSVVTQSFSCTGGPTVPSPNPFTYTLFVSPFQFSNVPGTIFMTVSSTGGSPQAVTVTLTPYAQGPTITNNPQTCSASDLSKGPCQLAFPFTASGTLSSGTIGIAASPSSGGTVPSTVATQYVPSSILTANILSATSNGYLNSSIGSLSGYHIQYGYNPFDHNTYNINSAHFSTGGTVTLYAYPSLTSACGGQICNNVQSWSGCNCGSTGSTGSCTVTLSADTTVSVTYSHVASPTAPYNPCTTSTTVT